VSSIVNNVDVTISQFPGGLVFVFVGSEYAGSADRCSMGVWRTNPRRSVPNLTDEFHDNMFAAVGAIVTTYSVASLVLALAV
jgi:hypothetical protein